MKLVSALAVALALGSTAALAQGGAVSKDKKVTSVPTSAECVRGWSSTMPWTQADFDKACAKVKAKK